METTFRQGNAADSQAVFQLFMTSVTDLGQRLGEMTITGGEDPIVLESLWKARQSMFAHLARTADQFWVAERAGRMIGYARSIRRGPIQELTEFFVLPDDQSAGVGRGLLEKAFPPKDEKYRVIVATLDERAQVRYLKAGVYPRFPLKSFSKTPEIRPINSDLEFQIMNSAVETLFEIAAVDLAVLGHTRPVDHTWIQSDRQGYIYRRAGRAVGYGYVGGNSGPFALLDVRDYPAVLAHAESASVGRWDRFGVEIPMINSVVVDYVLANGFRMEAFTALFMVNKPFGHFENYIVFSPPFLI